MRAVTAVALLPLLLPAVVSARCLSYGPSQVTVVGTLDSRTLPGAPNYVSVARGDYPETVLILRLEKAACVTGDPTSQMNRKSHSGLSEIQLSVAADKVRSLVGKKVRASGTLFGAHSGHHRTPVVLQVSRIGAS